MQKISLVIAIIILTGCASNNGTIYDTVSDLNSSVYGLLGVPTTYTAGTLAAYPSPSGCRTPKCVELDRVEADGYALARAGKIPWTQLVDRFYQRRSELYPDSNDQHGASELRTYQRMLAEQLDMKRLTESQWAYLIQKKNSDIDARNGALSNSSPRATNCTTVNAGTLSFPNYQTTCR